MAFTMIYTLQHDMFGTYDKITDRQEIKNIMTASGSQAMRTSKPYILHYDSNNRIDYLHYLQIVPMDRIDMYINQMRDNSDALWTKRIDSLLKYIHIPASCDDGTCRQERAILVDKNSKKIIMLRCLDVNLVGGSWRDIAQIDIMIPSFATGVARVQSIYSSSILDRARDYLASTVVNMEAYGGLAGTDIEQEAIEFCCGVTDKTIINPYKLGRLDLQCYEVNVQEDAGYLGRATVHTLIDIDGNNKGQYTLGLKTDIITMRTRTEQAQAQAQVGQARAVPVRPASERPASEKQAVQTAQAVRKVQSVHVTPVSNAVRAKRVVNPAVKIVRVKR